MTTDRLSVTLLIVGCVVMVVAAVLGPRGIYQTQDMQRREEIIAAVKTRWFISQSLFGISLLLTAVGFGLLAKYLWTEEHVWLSSLGAGVFVVGTISGLIFIYRQTLDPISSYQGAYSSMETLYYWLALASLLLFGIAFLQAGLAPWMGYLTAGATIIYGIFYLVSGTGFPTPGLVVILSLVIAIYLLRQ